MSVDPIALSPTLLKPKTWTVADYHAMIKAGILTEEDKVELLLGQIVEMSPVAYVHAFYVKNLNRLFTKRFSAIEYTVGVQDPVTLLDSSEPEPDLSVAKGPLENYISRHPGPTDLDLVVEVSDATLAKDLNGKAKMYAAAGIVEYWVIDVFDRVLIQHLDPDVAAGQYGKVQRFSATGKLESTRLGDFALGDLLPALDS